MAQALGIAGAIVAAVVAYGLGVLRDRQQKLREEQIRSATEFCRLLMEYSGAQLRRRTEEIRKEEPDEKVARAVRDARAQVWASYFHVMLVVDDLRAIELAKEALDCAVSIRVAGTSTDESVDYKAAKDRAELVRKKAGEFIQQVAKYLRVTSATQVDLDRVTPGFD